MKHIKLVYENEYAMVFVKPAGLPVQGGERVGISLDSILAGEFKNRPFLVHRLDKDTSGLILTAKTRDAAAAFSSLFAGGQKKAGTEKAGIAKQYLAVCAGSPEPPEGVIRAGLDIRGRRREARTSYRLLETRGEFSLLELELETGRMHQIRRHLLHIGHPVLGDDKYGDFSLNRTLRRERGLKKLLLHASRLAVPPFPPFFPQGLDLRAPLPEYFAPYVSPSP
ncbi:MAG: RluA family pseudouridine synthase [Treponema sp.]|jgi:23S rRNA pseudouridine955/2504/2580 synthase|nr:RluA family pseudouridine synthase [Treponema sp.]